MKSKKQFLYNDIEQYNYYTNLETEAVNLFNLMKQQAIETLGKGFDIHYDEFMRKPVEYLVSNYWKMANRPKHLFHKANNITVSDTGLDISQLNQSFEAFNRLLIQLKQYAPIIEKQGLKKVIKKENFNRNLDPKKAKQYHSLLKFLEASIELKEYGICHDINLLRYTDGLINNSGKLEINYYLFQE